VDAMSRLPHSAESREESGYSSATRRAEGMDRRTSSGKRCPASPKSAPTWEELNRRKATVYTHPTAANCCVNLVEGIGEATIELGADTTRTIASLIFSGTSQRYKDINWIFSHGGGAFTPFPPPFHIQMVSRPPYKDKFTRAIVDGELN